MLFTCAPAVFVMNHATPDDFQPLCLRQYHYLLVDLFSGTKTNIEGTILWTLVKTRFKVHECDWYACTCRWMCQFLWGVVTLQHCSLSTGNVSLSRSGLVQNGYGFPVHSTHKKSIDPAAVNFHLLPNNTSSSDNGSAFCVIKSDRNSKYKVVGLQAFVHGIQCH